MFVCLFVDLPSHSKSEQPVDLTVVGEEVTELLRSNAGLRAGQVAEAGDGKFFCFDKVQVDHRLEMFSPLLSSQVENIDVEL